MRINSYFLTSTLLSGVIFVAISIPSGALAATQSASVYKNIINHTKIGHTTVGAFLDDVLPKFQNSAWGTPVRLPGSVVEPLIYSKYTDSNTNDTTTAIMLFDVKNGKSYPADQITQAIFKGDFPTAYVLMLSEASGAMANSNGNQAFANTTPIFTGGNIGAYMAITTLRNSSFDHSGDTESADHTSTDDAGSAHASGDAGGK